MVFFGEYQVSFTGVGRIVLPKKIRELLKGTTVVITKGFDNCLSGYDKDEWESKAKDLMSVSLLEKENIEKRRFLFASTVYIEIDEQGRLVLPKNLLEYAGFNGKALIVGVGDHFEIWEVEKWNTYINGVQQ
jgi:MraZ protein